MLVEIIEPLTQFGVAGLMGTLWIWERLLSRKRERQLTQTHDRMMRHRESSRVLVQLVQRNTQAIERFDHTQHELGRFLELIHDSNQKRNT